MKPILDHLLPFLLGSSVTIAVCAAALLKNPEKVEKWLALLWKAMLTFTRGMCRAQKEFVRYDIQGSVNSFINHHCREMPGFKARGVTIEWMDATNKKQAFIRENQVVVRIRRDEPHRGNFVTAVYLFVATSLLHRAKRYISSFQQSAIDLFVSSRIFREEKPEVVDYFLDEYLHPEMDKFKKVGIYFDKFDITNKAGFFFPVFLQEMDFLGQQVYGDPKKHQIIQEVEELIDFLKSLSERPVGDHKTDLDFSRAYCRFAVVIVGIPQKLEASIDPYTQYIRKLDPKFKSIYLIGRAENYGRILEIVAAVSDLYERVSEKKVWKVIIYAQEKRKVQGLVAVLRAHTRIPEL